MFFTRAHFAFFALLSRWNSLRFIYVIFFPHFCPWSLSKLIFVFPIDQTSQLWIKKRHRDTCFALTLASIENVKSGKGSGAIFVYLNSGPDVPTNALRFNPTTVSMLRGRTRRPG